MRLVWLPLEAHGYQAHESLQHMIWEMNRGLDTYVAGRRTGAAYEGAAAAAIWRYQIKISQCSARSSMPSGL